MAVRKLEISKINFISGVTAILEKDKSQNSLKKEKRRQPLVARQCEDLVVIHDGVEGLDPHRIDVAIEENPLGSFSLEVRNVPHLSLIHI